MWGNFEHKTFRGSWLLSRHNLQFTFLYYCQNLANPIVNYLFKTFCSFQVLSIDICHDIFNVSRVLVSNNFPKNLYSDSSLQKIFLFV